MDTHKFDKLHKLIELNENRLKIEEENSKLLNECELKIYNIKNKSSYSIELKNNIKDKKEEIKAFEITFKHMKTFIEENKSFELILIYMKNFIKDTNEEINELEKELVIVSKYLFNPDKSGLVDTKHRHIYK
jgi:hypothetical protein